MAFKPKPVLKELMASTLFGGLDALDKEAEPYIPHEVKEAIDAAPISEEFKNALLPLTERGVHSPIGAVVMMLLGMVIGSAFGIATPIMRVSSYQIDKLVKSFRFDPSTVTQLWLRGFPNEEDKEEWWSELKDQGVSDRKIDAFKELANYLPSPTEIMTWAAREVFEPELREKYQLDKFLPPEFLEWAAKVGITGEVAKNYWASHWVLPSLTSIQELWRRQILKKEDVDAFWTELDMVPWVREDLFKLFRAVPTRVDVRRFWDMRTIDEPRLRDIYKAQGYWEEDLEDYVTWTKVYVAFPDLIARYRNTWISKEELMTELYALNPEHPERMDELYETKFKPVAEERVAETTALTRALIIKGAKEGKLSPEETIDLLILKKYSRDEAEYIYDLEVGAASSPETPMEFRQLVESYRKAVGLEYKEVPPELLDADKKRSDLRLKLAQAISKPAPEDEIAKLQADLEIAEVTFQNMKAAEGL